MKRIGCVTKSCRACRFYSIEGHRGGNCEILNVFVQGEWKACSQAQHPFNEQWDDLEQVAHLEKTLSLDCVQGRGELVNEVLNIN